MRSKRELWRQAAFRVVIPVELGFLTFFSLKIVGGSEHDANEKHISACAGYLGKTATKSPSLPKPCEHDADIFPKKVAHTQYQVGETNINVESTTYTLITQHDFLQKAQSQETDAQNLDTLLSTIGAFAVTAISASLAGAYLASKRDTEQSPPPAEAVTVA